MSRPSAELNCMSVPAAGSSANARAGSATIAESMGIIVFIAVDGLGLFGFDAEADEEAVVGGIEADGNLVGFGVAGEFDGGDIGGGGLDRGPAAG